MNNLWMFYRISTLNCPLTIWFYLKGNWKFPLTFNIPVHSVIVALVNVKGKNGNTLSSSCCSMQSCQILCLSSINNPCDFQPLPSSDSCPPYFQVPSIKWKIWELIMWVFCMWIMGWNQSGVNVVFLSCEDTLNESEIHLILTWTANVLTAFHWVHTFSLFFLKSWNRFHSETTTGWTVHTCPITSQRNNLLITNHCFQAWIRVTISK